jgi:hypothetical protein
LKKEKEKKWNEIIMVMAISIGKSKSIFIFFSIYNKSYSFIANGVVALEAEPQLR